MLDLVRNFCEAYPGCHRDDRDEEPKAEHDAIPPFRHFFVFPHHPDATVIEAGIVRLSLQRSGDDSTKGLLHGPPVLDEDVDKREGVVDKVTTSDKSGRIGQSMGMEIVGKRYEQVGDRIVRGAIDQIILDVHSSRALVVQYFADVVRFHCVGKG